MPMSPWPTRRVVDGFTLHDLLVAVTLVAILASASLAPVSTWHRRSSARAAAAWLRADLARARAQGVLLGETVTVVLDTAAGAWRAERSDGTAILGRGLPDGLTLASSAHLGRIPFTSRGTSNLYSTTWIGVADDPGTRWHGVRVSPTGAMESR